MLSGHFRSVGFVPCFLIFVRSLHAKQMLARTKLKCLLTKYHLSVERCSFSGLCKEGMCDAQPTHAPFKILALTSVLSCYIIWIAGKAIKLS